MSATEEAWGWPAVERILQDLSYALRLLRKNPGWSSVTVATLALGIGATTTIFSILNDFLLRPLPFREAERLVTVSQYDRTEAPGAKGYTSPPNYLDWKAQNNVFQDMAAWDATADQVTLSGVPEPERLRGARVTANFFPLLGVSPLLGRAFGPEQDKPGGATVAVLGYGLWQRQFGGNPDVLGKNITLDGHPFRIVGIMPRGFQFMVPAEEVWVPMGGVLKGGRGGFHLKVIARLKPGATLAKAQTGMATVSDRLAREYPQENRNRTARVEPLRDRYAEALRPALMALMGAVSLLLLIACANVAGLLLARASARRTEMAIRRALGASTGRIFHQALTESILLALLGGAIGFAVSVAGVRVLYAAVPARMHPLEPGGADLSVLAFALAASLLTAVLFGVAPAWGAARHPRLREKRGRLRQWLVVSEVAFSAVLLVGAGLLIKSFARLLDLDFGFRAENVLTANVSYRGPNDDAFYTGVLERIATLPGVRSTGAANFIPINTQSWGQDIYIEGGAPRPAGDFIWVGHRSVSLGYFRAIGIRLLRGREFVGEDARLPVSIINAKMARAFWQAEDPIGKRFKIGVHSNRWISVIGVVADVKYFGLEDEAIPEMYFVEFMSRMTLVVRAEKDAAGLAAAVRGAVHSVDRDQPVSDIRTMDNIISDSAAPRRLTMLLTGLFAALALLLAGVGLYGLIAYSVARRSHEFGVRMAIGAQRWDILRGVLTDGLLLWAMGALTGLAGAWVLTTMMNSVLFGVDAHDPAIFGIVPLVLGAVALLASYLPARRAANIDPIKALRYE
jgi:putative ABC transport system permease protein